MFDRSDDAANGGESLPFVRRMGIAVVAIALVLAWKHFNSPAEAMASWSGDWNRGVMQSRQSGKPALVLVTADWCPACRQLESEVLSREDVKKYLAANCTPIVVDLSDRSGENNRRATELNVRSIPTLILFDRGGREVARSHGMPADVLTSWIESGGTNVRIAQ